MAPTRTEALTAVLDDISAFEINLSQYYSDLEPQSYYDTFLTGLVNSLLAFCQTLGWSELIPHLRDMTPFRGNAVESLDILKRFVVPEARRLIVAGDIEMPRSSQEFSVKVERSPKLQSRKVFIGHGRSLVWLQLKVFLSERLHLTCDEFNAEAVAGLTTTARLQKMLDEAGFAFLVMTAEDIYADNTSHARENVIHEAGLFQGRLGFERAIILLEEGCFQFSNIHGLSYINFPKGSLESCFEKIRHVLEREDVLRTVAGKQDMPVTDHSEGEPCPKCFKNGWRIESSSPDPTFGELGVSNRVYKCQFCGFSENKLVR